MAGIVSTAAQTAQFGVIGLGVMGQNLALNIEDHGNRVAVWNLEPEVVDQFVRENGGRAITGTKVLEEFVGAIQRPRRILMMIKAGSPVDEMLAKLAPYLSPGDIIIDGGNSWFKDTQRREAEMRAKNLNFFGMGVSGGEEGARYGPSLMPGGAAESYEHMRPILEAIAAKTETGPCVTYVGPDGAGHFVKMVHNGIEYGDMELIAEAYNLLRTGLKLSAVEMAEIFAQWNRGVMESYLVEITAEILTVRDTESDKPLVDVILDKAGQKGTGKWTAQVALDLAVPIPTIAAAIDARVLSSMKDERVLAARELGDGTRAEFKGDKQYFIDAIGQALYAAKICSYAQGMSLIKAGSDEYGWNVKLSEMARIWTGGCIIRARLLRDIMEAFDAVPSGNRHLPAEGRYEPANLLLAPKFKKAVQESESGWREVIATAVTMGVPVPSISASLAYFDSYRSSKLPQNLTQAQRDYFGAHTYERNDRPGGGAVHTEWQKVVHGAQR